MPTSLTLKNIPDAVYERLKAAAELHRRSLNRCDRPFPADLNSDAAGLRLLVLPADGRDERAMYRSDLDFAPMGRSSIARGETPGLSMHSIASPNGADEADRPVGAQGNRGRFPGVSPLAINVGPFGAKKSNRN